MTFLNCQLFSFFVVLHLSCSVFTSAFCTVPNLVLVKQEEQVQFSTALFLADPKGEFSFDQVSSDSFARFSPIPKDPDELLKSSDIFWLKFTIQNQEETDLDWVFDFKYWSYLEFYARNESQLHFEKQISGNLTPVRVRSYPRQNNVLVLKHLKAKESSVVFVRLEINRNYEYIPLDLSFSVQERTSFDNYESRLRQFTSIFMAIYAVMFLYNLFIYFFTKDNSYLYYLGYLLSFMYLTASYGGYLFSFFDFLDFLPKIKTYLDALGTLGVTFFSIWFAKMFLHLPLRYPNWDRMFNYTIWAACAVPIITLINFPVGIVLSNTISFYFIICIVIVTVKSVREKYPSSIYLLLAIAFSVIGTFIFILASLNVLPQNDFTVVYAMPLGSNIEAILFSLALGNKLDLLRKENVFSQLKALEASLENERIVKEQNVILEEKVLARTAEITKQKEIIEHQMEKADHLLLNILPAEIASELQNTGFAKARSHQEATVLFTDFKGFTNLSEQLGIDELHKELDYCFRAFDDIVEKYGVEKIKTIGDSYMCASGVPSPNKDHALLVVKVGLEMRDFVEKWKAQNEQRGKRAWQIRIGIHSGPLVSGVIGKKKFAYDIWGNTVNAASRMESSGEVGKVNISETTYALVKNEFDFTYRGKIVAKNLGEVGMYFVN